ncbi:alpha/beta hydrolase [Idiomarina sp. HP20-50]|uniref:alpha/beta fold hydrolase n=1 Tax=Idiomarina sp. HP20-50 TaxID=3070813 RepID=UPI00294B9752|nr:alpha/beta hydrolase [Idiomarina sp. HP20-50]MDV6315733.1 alpha/beta hydrolase [Idiomarina sp. HP20-50]
MLKVLSIFIFILFSAQVEAGSMLEVDGNSIEYEVKKGGDVVVLFDAGALSGMAGWNSIWDDLPAEITAIRFSRLGEGNSDACSGQRSTSDYVNEVDQLLSELNIERPIVYVSHSLGGITARNFAAQHKGDVSALLMIDPANPRDVDIVTQLDPSGGQAEIEAMKKNDYAMGDGKWCFLDVIWDKSQSAGFSDIGDIPVTLIAGVKVPEQPSSVFESEQGRLLWGQYQSEWVNQFPKGKAVLTNNSGHFVQDEEPELVLDELVKLLNRL